MKSLAFQQAVIKKKNLGLLFTLKRTFLSSGAPKIFSMKEENFKKTSLKTTLMATFSVIVMINELTHDSMASYTL